MVFSRQQAWSTREGINVCICVSLSQVSALHWWGPTGRNSSVCSFEYIYIYISSYIYIFLLLLIYIYIYSKSLERQVYAPRLEPTAPIRLADQNHAHYPSRRCTILKKRRLNDRLPARMNLSTWESSEDVFTYTWHAKSMVQIWAPFCSPKGNQSDWLRHLTQGVNGWWYFTERKERE